MSLRLDWTTSQVAAAACKRWHYSKGMPTPPHVCIGVWEDDRFIGVVVFSRGNAPYIGRPFGVPKSQIAELTRIALDTHDVTVSKVVSIAVKMLRRQSPRLRLLVSFADPAQEHVGTIYQAGNWVYLGETAQTTMYRDPTGRVWHSRMVSVTGWKKVYGKRRQVVKPADCEPIRMPGKHKYALPLDTQMRVVLSAQAKPYPKRAAVLTGEA